MQCQLVGGTPLPRIAEKIMDKSIAQVYDEALNLFKDKKRFAQGHYHYDEDGNVCGWAKGYSFCALGALSHFTDGYSHKAQCCLQRVSEYLFEGKIIQEVNDGEGGYEKVLAALSFAKLLWEGQEPTEQDLGTSVPDLLERRKCVKQP